MECPANAEPQGSHAPDGVDLQFGHSQRVGYDVATNVLNQLQGIGALHKRRPEHASLGVLRSPDIPSILVHEDRWNVRRTQNPKARMLRTAFMQCPDALQLIQYVGGDIIPDALRMTEL